MCVQFKEMDTEIPVLAGYLNIPTQSGFSLNRISKKKTQIRYCLLFKSSRHGIERLEICESKEDKNPKIITLENCVKITQEPAPVNNIQVVKKTGTLTLNTLNDDDLKDWVNALQMVAFRDKTGPVIEEDNDLYCTSYDGLFMVTLIPSDTSIRCNIESKAYMLHLTATDLQLKSVEDLNIVIATWPYRFIRKYGYRDGKFTFEAGRKCTTGEGVFTLNHSNPQEVFRSMSAKMKSMKKFINGEKLNTFECVENQLSVAAAMEAGSRSPLPPSPSSQTNTDNEFNSMQSVSLHSFISSNDSLNNFSQGTNFAGSKNIPNKPPRKMPCTSEKLPANLSSHSNTDKFTKYQTYEPVSITTTGDPNKTVGSALILKPSSAEDIRPKYNAPELPLRNDNLKTIVTAPPGSDREYECIESITEAWKTLGLNEIRHTERNILIKNENDAVEGRWNRHQTKKIVDIDIGENNSHKDINYDRLDFFSPNNDNSSGYKTIVNVSAHGIRHNNNRISGNDYEFIASPDTQSCRKADDSHIAYGMLRKPSAVVKNFVGTTVIETNSKTKTIQTNDTSIDIHNSNANNYSIVSKPKRV